jgi:hypothetical protein
MTDTSRAEKWVENNITANSRQEAEQILASRGINYEAPIWNETLNKLYPRETELQNIEQLPEEQQATAELLEDKQKEEQQEEANPIVRAGRFIRKLLRGEI